MFGLLLQLNQRLLSSGQMNNCLARLTLARIKDLKAKFPAAGMSGNYTVADAWPNGIHSHWSQMDKADLPLCGAVKTAVASIAPLEHELSCKSSFYHFSSIARPTWSDLAKAKLLLMAKRLETLIEASSGRALPRLDVIKFRYIRNLCTYVELRTLRGPADAGPPAVFTLFWCFLSWWAADRRTLACSSLQSYPRDCVPRPKRAIRKTPVSRSDWVRQRSSSNALPVRGWRCCLVESGSAKRWRE